MYPVALSTAVLRPEEVVAEALTNGIKSMPSITQVGLSDFTSKIERIVGMKSAVVAGVLTFLFEEISQGTCIRPGTRMP